MILLQILVFMLFILGNAYQGAITSFMIAPTEPPKLKSLDEVFESSQKILLSDLIDMLLNESEKYQNALKHGIVNNTGSKYKIIDLHQMYEENIAIILECNRAKYHLENGLESKFYIVEEKLFPYYVRLEVIYLSRFLKQWQLLMDWSFEAGLTKHWKNLVEMSYAKNKPSELNILKFDQLFVIFDVIVFLFVVSIATFCCELFWGNIVMPYLRVRKDKNENLNLMEIQRRKFEFLRKKTNGKKLKKLKKSKAEKLKVRRIQVKPINAENNL